MFPSDVSYTVDHYVTTWYVVIYDGWNDSIVMMRPFQSRAKAERFLDSHVSR
jgi:hypothetical protein